MNKTNLYVYVLFITLLSVSAFAVPGLTTYQARIIKPDNVALEANNVNFRFTILNPAADCVLYIEDYSAINMANSAGLVSFSLGSGTKIYPASATTFTEIFNNSTPSMACQGGGTSFTATASSTRKIVMQFNDGNGWQTLPPMNINAVPYAMYASKADNSVLFNNKFETAFVQYSSIPTCTASQALQYTGSGFVCIAAGGGGGGGASYTVTAGDVTAALGYTPVDPATLSSSYTPASSFSTVTATVSSLGSSVTAVTSTVSNLSSSLAAIVSSQWTTSGTAIYYTSGNVNVSGSIRISMDNATCAASYAGAIRYNAGLVQVCDGTTWSSMSGSGSVTSAAVISALGYTPPNPATLSTSFTSTASFSILNTSVTSLGSSITTLNNSYSTLSSSYSSLAASMAALGSTASGIPVYSNSNDSVFVGLGTASASTSSNNTALGVRSLSAITVGSENVAIGEEAMYSNTNGWANTAIGWESLYSNTSGGNNTAVGNESMLGNTSGYSNSGLGSWALYRNTTGSFNTAMGESSLDRNTTGIENVAFGALAGRSVITGQGNTFIGTQSGQGLSPGVSNVSGNTFLGYLTGKVITTGGNSNTVIGYRAADTLTTGSKNIVIGYNIDTPTPTSSNTLNIGNLIYGTNINGQNTEISSGSIGIGVVSPLQKLSVSGVLLVSGEYGSGESLSVSGSGARMFFYPKKSAFRAGSVGADEWDDANISDGSIAMGDTATAFGYGAISLGTGTFASSPNAVAIGRYSQATGDRATAFGESQAVGDLSTSFDSSYAGGMYSIAMGSSSANADRSIAMGPSANADGEASVAIGQSVFARAYRGIAVGSYNVGNGSGTAWISTDPIFEIGNSENGSPRSNAMTVLKNGKVGIGKTQPVTTLEVSGAIRISMDSSTCAASYAGAIRYNAGAVQFCDGSTWGSMGGGGSVTSAAVISALGYTPVSAAAASQWSTSGTTVNYLSGNVGIGTANPTYALVVSGVTKASRLLADDGTATNPSIAFASETGTGFYRAGANWIGLSINGTNYWNFDNANGFLSPTIGGGFIRSSNGTAAAPTYTFNGSSDAGMFRAAANQVGFSTAAIERLRITDVGRVGIGTSSPIGILDVRGGSAAAGVDGTPVTIVAQNAGSGNRNGGNINLIPGSSTGTGYRGSVQIASGTFYNAAQLEIGSGAPGIAINTTGNSQILLNHAGGGWGVVGNNSTGKWSLGYANTSSTNLDGSVLTWTNSGNVGIGTTNPAATLDVSGVVRATDLCDENGANCKDLSVGWNSLTHFAESVTTSAPNATVPVVRLLAANAAANVDVALSPKGTGALTAHAADNTAAGGNKRGQNAVDWQTDRGVATGVAAAQHSVIGGGVGNSIGAGSTGSVIAGGGYNTANGSNNAAIGGGSSNSAAGQLATVPGGYGNSAAAYGSTAMGYTTAATGRYSMSANYFTTAESYAQTTIGAYNMPKGGETTSSWVATDPLFVIGNGTGSGASRSTALMILKNGDVGVGTTSVSDRLTVSGNVSVTGDIKMNGNDSYIWTNGTGTGYTGIFDPFNSRVLLYASESTGNVGIGTSGPSYKLDVSGDLRITGTPYRNGGDSAWIVPSDERLKDVSGKYNRGLREIASLETIYFNYKKDNPKQIDSSVTYTGVLAQEVQKQIPEAVKEDKEGFLSLNTTPIFWAMVNAIKEIYYEINGVKAENAELKNQAAEQARKIQSLEAENAAIKERLDRLEKSR